MNTTFLKTLFPTTRDKLIERTIQIESFLGFGLLFCLMLLSVGVAYRLSIRKNVRVRGLNIPLSEEEPLLKERNEEAIESHQKTHSKAVFSNIMRMRYGVKKMAEIEDKNLRVQDFSM